MSADVILTKDKRIDYRLANAFPFKFFFNEKKVVFGGESKTHGEIASASDFKDYNYIEGRLWLDEKIISFWVYDFSDIQMNARPNDYKKGFWNDNQLSFKESLEIIQDSFNSNFAYEPINLFNWNIDIPIENVNDNDNRKVFNDNTYTYYSIRFKVISVKEFMKDMKVDNSGLAAAKQIHLMNAEEKEEYYKKHGKPKGFGSDKQWKNLKGVKSLTSDYNMTVAQKNFHYKKESMKYLKYFETCDEIFTEQGAMLYDEKDDEYYDIFPFVIKNKKVFVGDIATTHGDIYQKYGLNNINTIEGRVYENVKVISFWNLGNNKYDFKNNMDFFTFLGKELGYNFLDGEWRLDLEINSRELKKYEYYFTYNGYGGLCVLIPITDFCNSDIQLSKENTIAKELHLMNAEQKAKKLKELGYKPKHIKTPQGMSQAEYRNKTTKYKYTESFSNFCKYF